ncbi:MAG TPA: DoxX family protein [Ktedonobacterales bacterium]|nr:DoxX family protein [Ktedonobacterales bacterium]
MAVNFGLLILRVVIGLTLAAHGSQKMFGWFGGSGLKGFSAGTKRMGFRPPFFWAIIAALGEFGGGLLLALGLLTPLGALGMMGSMFVAIRKAHWSKGFWNSKGGIEFPLTLWTVPFAVGIAGPGNFSLDHLIGWPVNQPVAFVIASAVLMVALWVVMQVSKPQAAPAQQAPAQPTPPAAQSDSQPTAAGKSA